MSDIERNLPALSTDVAGRIELLKTGGLIEASVGGLQGSMDTLVGEHLADIALKQARGDTKPERVTYILNPDSRLLISYANRNYPIDNTGREGVKPYVNGLFGEVVELDEEGRPRYGVSTANPFQAGSGFVKVEIGDNDHGFTASRVDMKVDEDDPFSVIPDSLNIADLLAMMQDEPVGSDETVEDFLVRTEEKRSELRTRAEEAMTQRTTRSSQGLTDDTNPHLHLIVTDRNVDSLVEASKANGIFPLVLTVNGLFQVLKELRGMANRVPGLDEYQLDLIMGKAFHIGRSRESGIKDIVPAYVTMDYPQASVDDPETGRPMTLPSGGLRQEAFKDAERQIRRTNPVFSTILNDGLDHEYESDDFRSVEEWEGCLATEAKVNKIGHGFYEQVIRPSDPDTVQNYSDWLRKNKLDYMLTLYLRGLSQV